jgi:hypothetical protein
MEYIDYSHQNACYLSWYATYYYSLYQMIRYYSKKKGGRVFSLVCRAHAVELLVKVIERLGSYSSNDAARFWRGCC